MNILLSLAERLSYGRLSLTLPNGRRHVVTAPNPGPSAELTVHRPRFLRRLLSGGDLGFAEAYLDGDCDTDDLTALIQLATRNEAELGKVLNARPWVQGLARLGHRLHPNTRRGSRRNISAHYDLGNAFYAAWLDPTMTYSAAVFTGEDQSLEAAQREKYRRIAAMAGLRPEHHVLDIGCGWGGFALHAAREIGCRVTAVTISQAQSEEARKRVAEAGLEDRVEILLRDYRDIEGRYDRIVSIEMVEAVGEAWWPTYFTRLRELLAEGGRAVLQSITIDESAFPAYRRGADFIQRYIFPGGMLPSPSVLREQGRAAGLTPVAEAAYGGDYAETLRRWRDTFETAWPEIEAMGFDRRFRRLWRYYLAYCEAGFMEGRIDLRHIAFER